jgi:predicted DNA-binding transcriptional regulator AlpA
VASRPLDAPEALGSDTEEPVRAVANTRAQDTPEVADLKALAEHLEAAASLARRVAGSLETRLATSRETSPYALVEQQSEHTGAREELLTAREVAERAKVNVRTVRNWSRDGRAPKPQSVAGVLRWRRSDIDAWLSNGGER